MVALVGCGSVDFNDGAYTPLCGPGETRCVRYLNAAPAVEAYTRRTTLPIDDREVSDWVTSVESLDGVFDFIGTADLSTEERRAPLSYLVTQRDLVLRLHAVVDEELRLTAPAILARNTPDQLARIRVAVAPFLQRTNGSVGVANGDQVVLLFGTDRLAFNITDRGLDETWVRSVVVHELTHASHFASSTFATSSRGDPPMKRSLWVEGLATWGSAQESPRRYTLEQVFGATFGTRCRAERVRWSRDYLADFDDDDNFAIWWRDDGRDVRGYGVRTPGYCVAYFMAEAARAERSFADLLALAPETAYALERSLLSTLAR
jgi:hypothetical protein